MQAGQDRGEFRNCVPSVPGFQCAPPRHKPICSIKRARSFGEMKARSGIKNALPFVRAIRINVPESLTIFTLFQGIWADFSPMEVEIPSAEIVKVRLSVLARRKSQIGSTARITTKTITADRISGPPRRREPRMRMHI